MIPSEGNEKKLDELFSSTLGRKELKFDFDKWKSEHTDVLAEYQTKTKTRRKPAGLRRIMMQKNALIKYAAAAVVLIAALVSMNVYNVQPDGASVVWAEVFDQIRQISTYSYKYVSTDIANEPIAGFELKGADVSTVYYQSKSAGLRIDNFYNDELIWREYTPAGSKQKTRLDYSMKTVETIELNAADKEPWRNPQELIGQYFQSEYAPLASKVVNGIVLEGIRLENPPVDVDAADFEFFTVTLWVEAASQLPYSLAIKCKHKSSENIRQITMSDFQWNIPLTAAEFTCTVPADFTAPAETENIFNENTQQSYARDILDVSVLDDYGLTCAQADSDKADKLQQLDGLMEIWKAQDRVINSWPKYAGLKAELSAELQEKLGADTLSVAELLHFSELLREKFWLAGGCLSEQSYKYGYLALVLAEQACTIQPEDYAVIDNLVEAEFTVDKVFAMDEGVIADRGFKGNNNIELIEKIAQLRNLQYNRNYDQIANGRQPVFQDFVYAHDLAFLLAKLGKFDLVKDIVDWQIENAAAGGWECYLQPLEKFRELLKGNGSLNYNIFNTTTIAFPEEFRYYRGLDSFRGPSRRVRVPSFALQSNPQWTK